MAAHFSEARGNMPQDAVSTVLSKIQLKWQNKKNKTAEQKNKMAK